MARRPEPLFLARETYRRRRLIDAVRVLPVFGAVVFLIPILGSNDPGAEPRSTAISGLFIFGAWLALIVLAGLLIRRLSRAPDGVASDPLEPGTGADERGEGPS